MKNNINNFDSFILLRDMFIVPISYIRYTWCLFRNKQNINIQQEVSNIDIGYFLIEPSEQSRESA